MMSQQMICSLEPRVYIKKFSLAVRGSRGRGRVGRGSAEDQRQSSGSDHVHLPAWRPGGSPAWRVRSQTGQSRYTHHFHTYYSL